MWIAAPAVALFLLLAAAPVRSEETLTDRRIGNAVDDALMRDPATPADKIVVSATDGVIILSGTLDNILARDRAGAIAETVKGVRGIVNKIEVSAPSRSDGAIEEDVRSALRRGSATESWEITPSVKNGIVSLAGTVDSWQERELAARVAKGIIGVRGIDNRLKVEYASVRSDVELEKEIEKALRWDTWVDDALIEVSVADGDVRLTGTVGSLAEKSRAKTTALVSGVRSIDSSGLEVKWWARDERLRKGKYVERPEAEIEAAVRDTLRYDPRVRFSDVTVAVDRGVATLRGTVDHLDAKRAAGRDARNVVGVWAVKNQLKVRLKAPPSDSRVKDNVEAALRRDPYVEPYEINVVVDGGQVYLYGEVDTNFERAQADEAVSRQRGVTRVHNFLLVRYPDIPTYDPYALDIAGAEPEPYGGATDRAAKKSDWEIERDIETELFWSPFVDGDQVSVDVNDGVASLSGAVETWSERRSAEENAREAGAVAVKNDLRVSFGPEKYRQ
jgi:osmotically-inducible protein OsmY